MPPTFKPIADSAVLVEFENRIDESVNDQVLALLHAIKSAGIRGIIEAVPAYRSLLVYYDPLKLEYSELIARLKDLAADDSQPELESTTWEIPVWYGGPTALDLSRVAQHNDLTEQEVIDIHSSTSYRVYLVGFAPGWTFLGGLDERLHTPRLDSPRAEVPAGSISIAGQQGLICGPAMPSGWNLIGQTPERTWAPEQDEPFIINPGDYVKFRRIDEDEFRTLKNRAEAGEQVSQRHPTGAKPASRHPGIAEPPPRYPGNPSLRHPGNGKAVVRDPVFGSWHKNPQAGSRSSRCAGNQDDGRGSHPEAPKPLLRHPGNPSLRHPGNCEAIVRDPARVKNK